MTDKENVSGNHPTEMNLFMRTQHILLSLETGEGFPPNELDCYWRGVESSQCRAEEGQLAKAAENEISL